MDVDIRNIYEKERFDELFDKLEATVFPVIRENNRRGFPKHRALTLGLVKNRMFKYCCISKQSEKFPELSDYIFKLFDKMFYFKFTSIQINKNVVAPKHIDGKNVGVSLILSIGDYEGGNLFVKGEEFDTRYTAHIFDGSQMEHWNSPITSGTKYSFVLFNVNNNKKNDLKDEEEEEDPANIPPKLNTPEFFEWMEAKYDIKLELPKERKSNRNKIK